MKLTDILKAMAEKPYQVITTKNVLAILDYSAPMGKWIVFYNECGRNRAEYFSQPEDAVRFFIAQVGEADALQAAEDKAAEIFSMAGDDTFLGMLFILGVDEGMNEIAAAIEEKGDD